MKGPAPAPQVASTQIIPGALPHTLSPDGQEEHTPNLVHFLTRDTKSPESFSQSETSGASTPDSSAQFDGRPAPPNDCWGVLEETMRLHSPYEKQALLPPPRDTHAHKARVPASWNKGGWTPRCPHSGQGNPSDTFSLVGHSLAAKMLGRDRSDSIAIGHLPCTQRTPEGPRFHMVP